jgi:FkbM family methyltransferase
VIAWRRSGGYRSLLDYDLDENSVVLEVGGFEGQWASDIYARFRCRIHVFEPVAAYAAGIERRFARNPAVEVHRFGLAGRTGDRRMHLAGPGSSLWTEGAAQSGRPSETETVRLVSAREFFERQRLEEVELIKVNAEGAEYELLEHLIESRLMERIRHLQVQFHPFVPDAEPRMTAIQRRLEDTHQLAWQSRWVCESWTRRS